MNIESEQTETGGPCEERFWYVFFFNKLTFIQNTVPKEYDAAKHAGKVCHEAPVLMLLIFFLFFPFYIFYLKIEEPTPLPDPSRPLCYCCQVAVTSASHADQSAARVSTQILSLRKKKKNPIERKNGNLATITLQ